MAGAQIPSETKHQALSSLAFLRGHGLNSAWLNRMSFQTSLHSIGSVGCGRVQWSVAISMGQVDHLVEETVFEGKK